MKSCLVIFLALTIGLPGLLMGMHRDELKPVVKASISGTVYMDGRPVAGTIVLKDSIGHAVAQTRTTLAGHYLLKDIDPGDYALQFLNMQGVPFGRGVIIEVREGRFEQVDLHLRSTDRQPLH